MRFVQDATPGSEAHGYSQALLGVDGEWHGIEVRALEREQAVIEGDADLDVSATNPDTATSGAAATDTPVEQPLEADDD
jgi:hypothetical protein